MREGWKVSTLGKACQIKPPKTEARERLASSDMVSFVPMNDLGVREKGLKGAVDRTLASVAGSYTYFADGDVLLAKITPCFENGKLGIARGLTNGVGFGSSEFIVFRPDVSLDAEFLFYFLSQDSFRESGASVMSGAVGHKRVPKKFIERCPIPIPPLPEQKRIVAILDEAFAGIATAIANTEKNLANARELFESYLNAVFSSAGEAWKSSTLEDSCQIKPPKREVRNRLSAKDRVSFVPMNDLGICEKKLKAMEDRPYEAVSAAYTYFADGDVLLAKITPCFENGKIGIASELTNGVGFGSSEFIVLRPGPLLDAEYLFYFLSRDSFRSSGASVMSGAVGHKRVPNEFIARCLISLPPISEQKRIVAILDELSGESRRLKSIYQQKLNALAELKQSLLQKAFSGELTTAPQDEIETALA